MSAEGDGDGEKEGEDEGEGMGEGEEKEEEEDGWVVGTAVSAEGGGDGTKVGKTMSMSVPGTLTGAREGKGASTSVAVGSMLGSAL